jgi:hypothetical protein
MRAGRVPVVEVEVLGIAIFEVINTELAKARISLSRPPDEYACYEPVDKGPASIRKADITDLIWSRKWDRTFDHKDG